MMRYGFEGQAGHMFGYNPFGGLMVVGFILFAALLGWGLYAMLRRGHSGQMGHVSSTGAALIGTGLASGQGASASGDPSNIVRERLARGEIDVAQYNEIIAALQAR
ncbi:MAG: hypothetical protein KJ747_04075 [Actinobacteria bacterium]|nr:hypothetical protein [Actinomycetota bacterium]MCG2808015.1 hypothetical protein [Coriobacteriia bacterium]